MHSTSVSRGFCEIVLSFPVGHDMMSAWGGKFEGCYNGSPAGPATNAAYTLPIWYYDNPSQYEQVLVWRTGLYL